MRTGRFEHHNGFNPEHGYWWGRGPAPHRTYRYLVRALTNSCPIARLRPASAVRPNQPSAERDDVADGKAHSYHGGGLHRANRVRIDVGHRPDLRDFRY
jgi:hypothetical protein